MSEFHQKTIILSEDRYRALAAVDSYLRRRGVRLRIGGSGRELAELTRRERPDAVLIGYSQPDITGDDLCRLVRSAAPRPRHPPLLVVGPTGPRAIAQRCRRAGCDEYLGASAGPELMLRRLAKALGLQPRCHPRVETTIAVSSGDIVSEFLGYTRDISLGGVLLESSQRIGTGRHLRLRLFFAPRTPPIPVRATVLRSVTGAEADQRLLGLRFDSLNGVLAVRLKEHIAERLER